MSEYGNRPRENIEKLAATSDPERGGFESYPDPEPEGASPATPQHPGQGATPDAVVPDPTPTPEGADASTVRQLGHLATQGAGVADPTPEPEGARSLDEAASDQPQTWAEGESVALHPQAPEASREAAPAPEPEEPQAGW